MRGLAPKQITLPKIAFRVGEPTYLSCNRVVSQWLGYLKTINRDYSQPPVLLRSPIDKASSHLNLQFRRVGEVKFMVT